MEPCVTSIASACEVRVTGRSPPAVPGGSQTPCNPSGRDLHQQSHGKCRGENSPAVDRAHGGHGPQVRHPCSARSPQAPAGTGCPPGPRQTCSCLFPQSYQCGVPQEPSSPKLLHPEANLCLHQLAAAQPGRPRWRRRWGGFPWTPPTHAMPQG